MKLQLFRAYGALGIALLLAIMGLGLFGQTLSRQYGFFQELQASFQSESAMLLVCLSVWCGILLFLTFRRRDWPLLGLLLVGLFWYGICHMESSRVIDALILLAGVTLGKGLRFALKAGGRLKVVDSESISEITNRKSAIVNVLMGLVMLLAFASWWHIDLPGSYHGPRWMGLWNNPNIYGMLMGAGSLLAIGLLAHNSKLKIKNSKSAWFLLIAAGMMGVGLVMSYSRGAWLATGIALMYLAWCYGKLKWRHIVIGASVLVLGAGLFWGRTPDAAPWYVKRADLGRPSAQHRVSAWCGAVQMMRDYPLGVGWNQAVSVYDNNYSPPEGGAAALSMNSYLMLGTELGLPGLFCFMVYLVLCYRKSPRLSLAANVTPSLITHHDSLRAACLAGALVFVVAFWFDGGLFDLPTATVFWILLELGAYWAEFLESNNG